jgi:hypothetical protein
LEVERARQFMKSKKAMRPSADEHQFIEIGAQRSHDPRKRRTVLT